MSAIAEAGSPAAPASAPTPDPLPSGTVGAGAPLDPAAAKKAQLAAARRARAKKKADARERRRLAAESRKATKPAASEPVAIAEPAEPLDERSDAEVTQDLAALWGVVWRLAGFAAGLFGWQLAALTRAEAQEDAVALLPLARKYPTLAQVAGWVGIPFRLVERIAQKASRKPEPEAKPKDATP